MTEANRKVPEHVSENIVKIAEVQQGAVRRVNMHQRAVEVATRVLGRPQSLYLGAAIVAGWVLFNTWLAHSGQRVLDPAPFFWLQGAPTLYGAFVATMVLASQNRQREDTDQRAHLELQVNLLAEQKVTKIIALLEELRRDLPIVANRTDPLADAMQERADPAALLSALEDTMAHPPESAAKSE